MLIVIILMLGGIGLGFLLRHQNTKLFSHAVTGFIWLLLFLLGLEVGHNQRILDGLHTIGMEALLISAASTFGSVLAAWGFWHILHKKKKA